MKQFHLRQRCAALCFAFVVGTPAVAAATAEGTVTFTKTPPLALVVWDTTDASQSAGVPIVITQKNRVFSQLLAVVPPQGTVEFVNDDDQQHNVFVSDQKNKLELDFGLAQPAETVKQVVSWPSGTAVKFGCKIHPQMQTWIMSLSSARYQVVLVPDNVTQVSFSVPNVTSESKLQVWSPRGEAVNISLGGAAVDLTFKDKPCGQVTAALK